MTSTPSRTVMSRTLACSLILAPPISTAPPDGAPPAASPNASPTTATTTEAPIETPIETPTETPERDSSVEAAADPPPPRLTSPPAPRLPSDPAPDRCRPHGRDVCRPMTIGGAVLLGLGIVGLGSGIGMAALPDRRIEGRSGDLRSFRPAGVLLVGAAIFVATTGAFLLAESMQRRRGARPHRARRGR